ncbi:MAG: hypothetical protein ACK5SX_00255, partial [Sandaracinobacter sp.]
MTPASYGWIACAVDGSANPPRLSSLFPNRFLMALASVGFSLSPNDRRALRSAREAVVDRQQGLLSPVSTNGT